MYARFVPALLFSLNHIACHVFTHENPDWNKYLSHNVFQCVRIKPSWSSVTNEENSTINFCQSVQISCREEERQENNSNYKTFCLTRKRKKRYHHNGKQQLSFYEKVLIKTHKLSKKKNALVMRRTKMYYKKQKSLIGLFDKTCTSNVKCQMPYSTWRWFT